MSISRKKEILANIIVELKNSEEIKSSDVCNPGEERLIDELVNDNLISAYDDKVYVNAHKVIYSVTSEGIKFLTK